MNQKVSLKDLIRPGIACRILEISITTLRHYEKRGYLMPALHIGEYAFYSRSAVEQFKLDRPEKMSRRGGIRPHQVKEEPKP